MEFHHIVPHDSDMDRETEGNEDNPATSDPPIWSEVLTIPCRYLSEFTDLVSFFRSMNILFI